MSRNIYCKSCGEKKRPLCEEDLEDGWRERKVWQAVVKPVGHYIVINHKRFDLPELHCDLCNAPIPDGTVALLMTTYRATAPVAAWEHEYAVGAK